jgi:hypothetical protein
VTNGLAERLASLAGVEMPTDVVPRYTRLILVASREVRDGEVGDGCNRDMANRSTHMQAAHRPYAIGKAAIQTWRHGCTEATAQPWKAYECHSRRHGHRLLPSLRPAARLRLLSLLQCNSPPALR